ncbi:MAG TPA: putative toxin-antitoxin system toxin component, PIN family [Kiritimatiellia bacterium]|nr:putative toxin-antitoxin system toxin component, PIN family [Kiritimatiellia bacterium]
MKLVLDSNVILSGLIWGGKPYQILQRIDAGLDLLFTSRDLLVELERVLGYPKFKRYLEPLGLSASTLLVWVVEHSALILPRRIIPPVIQVDPSDNCLLECAWSAGVDYLVTGDKRHLLPLKKWKNIQIVDAAMYLDAIRTMPSTSEEAQQGEE